MGKKKTYTVKGHRQLQKSKEQIRKDVEVKYHTKFMELKLALIELIPGIKNEQVLTAVDAGLDVTLETKVSAKALLEILRS
jgi:hypothetical protein